MQDAWFRIVRIQLRNFKMLSVFGTRSSHAKLVTGAVTVLLTLGVALPRQASAAIKEVDLAPPRRSDDVLPIWQNAFRRYRLYFGGGRLLAVRARIELRSADAHGQGQEGHSG